MGIKSLNKFLRNNCPEVYEPIHISDFAFKKVAIDTSLYLCKFKTVCGDHWLSAFINLIACLRRNEIHCVFIYDTDAPPEKSAERADRRAQQEKAEMKVCELEEALEHYHMTNEIPEVLIELNKKRKSQSPTRLISKKPNNGINMVLIEKEIARLRQQILNISEADFSLTKELFDILQVPYYQAPLEAETTCADLCKRGLVDAVLSEDTDVLAYGAPVFLSKIETSIDNCVQIKHRDILDSLELSYDEFLDLCIMCGTDYNKNISRIGPEKAYKLIQQHRSIDEIGKNTNHDISVLNHVRGRQLFKEYKEFEVEIPYCGSPDFDKLEQLVKKHNIRVNIDNLRKAFVRDIIMVEEEEVEFEIDDSDSNENDQ